MCYAVYSVRRIKAVLKQEYWYASGERERVLKANVASSRLRGGY
jgi:hypothetical protein